MNILIGFLAFFITHKYILYLIIFFTGLIILYNSKTKKLYFPVHINFILLLLFGITYTLFSAYNNVFNITILIYPIVMYYIGACLYKNNSSEKNVLSVSNSIIIGLIIHATLNYFNNITNINRNILDIFIDIPINATLHATFITMFTSTFFVNLQSNNVLKKAIIIFFGIIALLFVLLIGSRTSIIIFIITSIFSIFLIIIYSDKTSEDKSKKIKVIITIIISIFVILSLYEKNYFDIKNKVESSNLYYRLTKEKLDASDKVRYDNQFLGFVSLIKNPFGTKEKIGLSGYAHNMWLDIGKDAGIFCFIFLVMYSIGTLKSLILINKSKKVSKMYKIYFNSLYLGVFLNFQVEPILEAIPLYFGLFALINSMIDMQCLSLKNVKKKGSIL